MSIGGRRATVWERVLGVIGAWLLVIVSDASLPAGDSACVRTFPTWRAGWDGLGSNEVIPWLQWRCCELPTSAAKPEKIVGGRRQLIFVGRWFWAVVWGSVNRTIGRRQRWPMFGGPFYNAKNAIRLLVPSDLAISFDNFAIHIDSSSWLGLVGKLASSFSSLNHELSKS